VDGRRKVLKSVQDGKGTVFLSDKVKEEELPALLTGLAKRQDRKLGPEEARLLAAHLGADLAKAVKEVEKLCIVTEPKGTITSDLIQRIIGISKDHNIFELQNAIGTRDTGKAQRIARYFASDQRNHPLPMTIGFLNGYLTKLAMVYRLEGRSPQEMAAAMKVSPYFVKDYVAHARNYSLGRVVEAQRRLRQCDLRSKGLGGDSDHGELLREFLARMMQ
jgi:DNA polymerase-3 subunit delta